MKHINDQKASWTAKVYPEWQQKQMKHLHLMGGGRTFHPPAYRAPTEELLQEDEEVDIEVNIQKMIDEHKGGEQVKEALK